MTIEKAVEVVTNAVQCGEMTCEQDKALAIVQKVLEKQMPKQPKKYIDLYGTTRNGCPVCPKNEILYAGQKYCSVCGQAIDWNFVEDGTERIVTIDLSEEYLKDSYFSIIGNVCRFNLKYVSARKATETDKKHFTRCLIRCGYVISTNDSKVISWIPIEDVNADLLHEILSYIPRTFFDCKEITDYQEKVVPLVLEDMKKAAPELYSALTENYPEYNLKD